MSSPSPSKSFRTRMGGLMRRTSSVLAMASSRPSMATPATTPTPAGSQDDARRSSVSKSVEGRMSTSSLTPSGEGQYTAPLDDTSALEYFPASDGLRELAKSIPPDKEEVIAQEMKGIRDNADGLVEINERE
ncbi:hypothetical protein K438DRAFT_1957398 [Mycena galopus ATCC 62051]|nr:hypothetical protein K438DRAFT_1957398 [Mycena galopus ATCC 62051]